MSLFLLQLFRHSGHADNKLSVRRGWDSAKNIFIRRRSQKFLSPTRPIHATARILGLVFESLPLTEMIIRADD